MDADSYADIYAEMVQIGEELGRVYLVERKGKNMAALGKESKLYEILSEKYDNREDKDITFAFFEECVSIVREYSRSEIRFVLFKLKCLYDETDTGIDQANLIINSLNKLLSCLTGKNMKVAFIMEVLNSVLEDF